MIRRPALVLALLIAAAGCTNPPPPAPTSLPPKAPWRRPSSYHSSMCALLIPFERRFLCSQCSCISVPNARVSPSSSARRLRSPSSLT